MAEAVPSFAVGLQKLVLEEKNHSLIKPMPKITVKNQVLHDSSITKQNPIKPDTNSNIM